MTVLVFVMMVIGFFTLITVLVYLLGFSLGGSSWLAQAQRVRAEAAVAERQLHDLTRQAFVAMAEEAERVRSRR